MTQFNESILLLAGNATNLQSLSDNQLTILRKNLRDEIEEIKNTSRDCLKTDLSLCYVIFPPSKSVVEAQTNPTILKFENLLVQVNDCLQFRHSQ
jgi:hypothetical protein